MKKKLGIEQGIYTSPDDSSFESDSKIKRKLSLSGVLPDLQTPLPLKKDWRYWTQRFRDRQLQYQEAAQKIERNHVEIAFKGDTLINFIGDVHAGAVDAHYDRLEQEVETIVNTPNSYVIVVGDLVDGFFFNPAQFEQVEQTPEQWSYINSLLKYLSEQNKLLIGFGGDHDGWPKKMGIDPYTDFAEDLGAYYMQGIGHLTAMVDDQEYKLTGTHRLPGFSMYNNVHPQMRASKEIQGADVYFSAHTHTKGHSFQSVKQFGGGASNVHFISLGPYKSMDEYSRKLGWMEQSVEEMFGCSIMLHSDTPEITYFHDILQANETMKG